MLYSCQLQNLQRQKESHVRKVKNLQEELKREQLKQLSCVEKQSNRAMSELERQLGCAKAELFSERRRAREKQESMQQVKYDHSLNGLTSQQMEKHQIF